MLGLGPVRRPVPRGANGWVSGGSQRSEGTPVPESSTHTRGRVDVVGEVKPGNERLVRPTQEPCDRYHRESRQEPKDGVEQNRFQPLEPLVRLGSLSFKTEGAL